MRLLSVFTLFFVAFASAGAQEPNPGLYFYIISVPPPSGFDELPSLKERADALDQFITLTYNLGDRAHLQVLTKPEETTAASIRQILYGEIPSLPTGSVIFLFLLTHGELQRYPNVSLREAYDLQIVTSDTSKKRKPGTTIHGIELINALAHAPRQSMVFAFLDSCSSGALGTPLNELLGMLSNRLLESRMLVMTSSALGEPSYAGDFTQALIDVWRDQKVRCIKNQYFIDEMDARLAQNGQKVQIIIPFNGPCLNFANEEIGLLVLSNNSEERIYLKFPDGIGDIDIGPNEEYVLIPVPRRVKSVSVFSGKRPLRILDFDLSQFPITRYQVNEETNAAKLAPRYLAEADRVAEFGFEQEAQVLKLAAAGAARIGGDEPRAKEIEASINRKFATPEVLAVLDYYQNKMVDVTRSDLGDYLISSGRFSAAYSVYSELFERNKKNPEVFGTLYTSLALAGKEEAAKELRLQYPRLFQLSPEAQQTKVLLNVEGDVGEAAALNGLDSAATRLGILAKEQEVQFVPGPMMMLLPP